MSHTEGKLSLEKYGNIKTEGGDDFRLNGATLSGNDVAVANTRRLVACWNACDGLPQDDLDELAEMPNAVMNLARFSDDLVKERDELVALLYDLLSVADADPELSQYPAAKATRELLAKKYPEAS